MIRLDLPFPPPLSACFTNRVGKSKKTGLTFVARATTSRYEKWQKQALQMIQDQRPQRMLGQVSVYVRLVAPDKRERDAGNCDKSLMDILVKAGIIAADSNRCLRRITYEWQDFGPPCTILIQAIEPVQPSFLESEPA